MEVDELANRWERLQLSKEESSFFHVKPEEDMEGGRRGKHSIIGRALTEKLVNSEGFRVTMSQIWRLKGWVRFKELGDQCFLIEFQCITDKEKVLSGRPWFYDRSLLIILEVDESVSINALRFEFKPFWVQLHNLPLAAMTEDFGTQFASSVGHVIRVESDSEGLAWGRCMRVRVAVNLHKPLLRGKWLMFDKQKHWISFKYERLQNFCFHCGVLYHRGKSCSRPRFEHQGEEQTVQQYGAWLKAHPKNTNIFDNHKYGGSDSQKQFQGDRQGGRWRGEGGEHGLKEQVEQQDPTSEQENATVDKLRRNTPDLDGHGLTEGYGLTTGCLRKETIDPQDSVNLQKGLEESQRKIPEQPLELHERKVQVRTKLSDALPGRVDSNEPEATDKRIKAGKWKRKARGEHIQTEGNSGEALADLTNYNMRNARKEDRERKRHRIFNEHNPKRTKKLGETNENHTPMAEAGSQPCQEQ
ncbi:uncharacterized protein LOC122282298 [Carya illinoinensis]|uniref:uncharacterized protein LOC122282298 n=1 Tax=Carya illinoinensis TaxID=32201 RepID=UPI001C724022|nr:uncharacterized protein LOC122282298 [Carya illinoinensis]